MYIRIKLPKEYSDLGHVKRANYPFKTAFSAFMLSVVNLAERGGFSHYAVFGYIEHELANGKPLELTGDGPSQSLDYKEYNEDILKFYKTSNMPQKQMTIMFIRLVMRLRSVVGDSIPEMIYLIDQLEGESATATNSTSAAVIPDDTASMVKISKRKTSASSTPPAPTTSEQPRATTNNKPAQPKSAVSNGAVKVAEKSKSTAAKKQSSDDKVDSIVKRANKLKADADKAVEGVTATTNPLLGDFFDV